MGLLRAPDGTLVDAPDEQVDMLAAGGYTPVDAGTAGISSDAMTRPDSGALSGVGAFASSTLSGATLGLSDYALKGLLDRGDFERMARDRELHPVLSGIGEGTGMLLPSLAGGGAAGMLPSGVVGRTAMGATEVMREVGGAKGALGAMGVAGLEGSLYNAVAYLSDTALSDRELSAEGLAGALGAGFEFGVAGGAAAMGIERGSIAARRMFSRLAEGGERAAQRAEQAWMETYQTTLEANDAAVDIARAKLAEAQLATQEANVARQNAAATVAQARAAAPGIDAAASVAEHEAHMAGRSPVHRAAELLNDAAHPGVPPDVMSDISGQLQRLASQDRRVASGLGGVPFPEAVGLSPAAAQDLAVAVAEHDAARAELDDILRRIEAPEVGQPGGAIGQSAVPVGEFGAPGARGYNPGEVAAPGPPSQAPLGAAAEGTPVTRALRKGAQAGEPTSMFDIKDSGLRFNPDNRTYHYPTPEAAEQASAEAQRAIRDGRRSVGLAPRTEPTVPDPWDEVFARASAPSRIVDEDGRTIKLILDDTRDLGHLTVKPFRDVEGAFKVNYTELPEALRGKGVGTSMYGRLATYLDEKYGGKLISDYARSADAERLWRGLERRGLAREVVDEAEGISHFELVPPRRLATAGAKTPDDLLASLQGTSAKLSEGQSIGKISAESPARAEYVANKAERTAEAAAHFRAKATGSDLDPFFADLRRPKTWRAYLEQNIGRAMREEGSHAAGVVKLEREWAEVGGSHPLALQRLEQAHDVAVERAATAIEPAERAAAEAEVASIEHQLSRVGARPGAVEDVAAAAEVVTKYERASAKLVEALGPDAPPAAQAAAKTFRDAEAAAERRTMERTTRAIDDHVEVPASPKKRHWKDDVVVQQNARGSGRPLTIEEWRAKYQPTSAGPIDDIAETAAPGVAPKQSPAPKPGQQYIEAAKQGKLHADAGHATARAREAEAKLNMDRASSEADRFRAKADAARPGPATPAGKGSALSTIATAVGVAGELGIPGIPKPHDIPIVGPLLSVFLKYKAIKATAGRFVGRVPATADAKVAALAARTKDRIATAVDRTLGLAAKPAARTATVIAAEVLGRRAFDDGEPDAKKGASTQELAAVRIREIATAASRPDLVTQQVRRQLRGVTDPDLIAAAEKHMMARFEYLASVMPKLPPDNLFTKTKPLPSPAAASDLAQRLAAANDPVHALEDPTPAKAETLAKIHPRLLEMAKQRLMDRVGDMKHPMPYATQLRASIVYGMALMQSMEPSSIATLQSAHAAMRPEPSPQPAAPPTPSIAAPAALNQMYDPGNQRRAARM